MVPQGRWAGRDNLSHPYRPVVLAGLRAAPLARLLSSSKASLYVKLSKLNGMKLRLFPLHCDGSACLHQNFFCTYIFNEAIFMLSKRPPSSYLLHHFSNWLRSLLHHFLHQTCLAPQEALYPCSDILITISHKLQPTLLIVTSRTLCPLALSVIVIPFLGRGNSSLPICLGLCKGTSMESPCTWSPRTNGICKDS